MADVNQLIEELKLRMNSATQTSQDQINSKTMEILEALAARSEANLEREVAELRKRLAEAEERLAKFAKFDGDGDGRPGGSKPRRPPLTLIEDDKEDK